MARQEQDREDWIAEATALVDRVEFGLDADERVSLIGFRQGGAASLFWSSEEVYHFDPQDRLRRMYGDGCLYKAHKGGLVRLRRERVAGGRAAESEVVEVVLRREELALAEQTELLERLRHRLDAIQRALRGGTFRVTRYVLADPNAATAEATGRVSEWLERVPRPILCSDRPGLQSRRGRGNEAH